MIIYWNKIIRIRLILQLLFVTRFRARADVELKVYDALGNLVETLVNREQEAGVYQVEFNPVNLASGIYFYQIKTNSFVETKKLVLLK